jgi:hypothetical protein
MACNATATWYMYCCWVHTISEIIPHPCLLWPGTLNMIPHHAPHEKVKWKGKVFLCMACRHMHFTWAKIQRQYQVSHNNISFSLPSSWT